MQFDMPSVYAPNSDEPLIVDSAIVDIFSQKVWVREPSIYGTGEENKFRQPPDITIELSMHDMQGVTYKTTLAVREITINQKDNEPDD